MKNIYGNVHTHEEKVTRVVGGGGYLPQLQHNLINRYTAAHIHYVYIPPSTLIHKTHTHMISRHKNTDLPVKLKQ